MTNLVEIGSTRVAPHVGEKDGFLGVFYFLSSSNYSSHSDFCFVNSPTDNNSQRILTYGVSKDVVWVMDVPGGYPMCLTDF